MGDDENWMVGKNRPSVPGETTWNEMVLLATLPEMNSPMDEVASAGAVASWQVPLDAWEQPVPVSRVMENGKSGQSL